VKSVAPKYYAGDLIVSLPPPILSSLYRKAHNTPRSSEKASEAIRSWSSLEAGGEDGGGTETEQDVLGQGAGTAGRGTGLATLRGSGAVCGSAV